MNRRRKKILTGLVLLLVFLAAFFSDRIPFFVYQEEIMHTTLQEFLSAEHLVRLMPFVIIAAASALIISLLVMLQESRIAKERGYVQYPDKKLRKVEESQQKADGRQRRADGKLRKPGGKLTGQKTPAFMAVRWICMISFSILVMFGGIFLGTVIHGISLPVLACPTNRDQLLESSCYFLAHLPELFEEYSLGGVLLFFGSTVGFALLLGRAICGFLCPMGLIQDIMHRIRQKTKVQGITMTEARYKKLAPVRWLMVFLMFGLVFAGKNFCAFCPALATSPIFAGLQVSLYFSGFMMIFVLVGSFFKRRAWCNICPLGYLLGLLHKVSPFRIKKDIQACTECGACYEACPMGIKAIYTERGKTDVTDVNCIMCGECIRKCPENHALSMTFAGKTLYTASRMEMMSVFQDRPCSGKAKPGNGGAKTETGEAKTETGEVRLETGEEESGKESSERKE